MGKIQTNYELIAFSLTLLGLSILGLYNYLLFHCIAELFSITVGVTAFFILWNSRRIADNNYILILGVAFLFISSIDCLHTLSYKGMGVFPGEGPNLPAQLWVAARYLQAGTFLAAPLFLERKLRGERVLLVYFIATGLLLGSIFYWNIFPDCYIEGVGLTSFKRLSEYLISSILAASFTLLLRNRGHFEGKVMEMLLGSIFLTIISEVTFTLYVGVYWLPNIVGHLLKIVAFYLIYRAIIQTAVVKPYSLIFRELKQSEGILREYSERLEEVVEERTLETLESRERFEAFMESAVDAFAIYDQDLRLIEINKAGLDLFPEGTRKGDLIGRRMTEVVPGLEKTERYGGYLRVLETGKPYTTETYSPNPMFGERWLETRAFKVGNDLGLVTRDVTEGKQITEKLIQAERMGAVSRIAAMMAHDLRGPLQIINQAVRLIEISPDKAPNMLKMIEDNVRRALDMIEELRTATSPYLTVVETDLAALIRRSVEESPVDDSVEVELQIGGGLERVDVDPFKIRRVMDNLILNAIEAMPRGGRLTVKAERRDHEVQIRVGDTGVGIKESEISKLYMPFYTTKAKGMGLGLPFAKLAVEAHGGSMGVESNIGEGTIFTITLPVGEVKVDALVTKAEKGQRKKGSKDSVSSIRRG